MLWRAMAAGSSPPEAFNMREPLFNRRRPGPPNAAKTRTTRSTWGAQMRSRSSLVLVEQAAKWVASAHLALPILGDVQLGGWIRCFQAQRPVRAVLVVVLHVDAQDLPGALVP